MVFDTRRSLEFTAYGIVLMWALWTTIVTVTDLFDLFVQLQVLQAHFSAASGNFALVEHFLDHYRINYAPLAYTIFITINGWIGITAIVYWRAITAFHGHNQVSYARYTILGFLLNMGLCACFLIADEIFIQYAAGHSHMNRLMFMLLTFVSFLWLRVYDHSTN